MSYNRDNYRDRNDGRDSGRNYDQDRRQSSYSNYGNIGASSDSGGRGGRGYGNAGGNMNGPAGGSGGRGFGGRGNGGASNGGRGNNRHMGEHPVIQNLLRTYDSLLNDRACLSTMDPVDTNRESRVGGAGNDTRALPVLAEWRYADPVGLQLDQLKESTGSRNVVRSNFFRVPTHRIPEVIYQYSVAIFKYKMVDGILSLGDDPEDITAGSDKLAVTVAMNGLLDTHSACWHQVGTVYNGASALYTTHRLAFPLQTGLDGPIIPEGAATKVDYDIGFMYESDVFMRSSSGEYTQRPMCNVVLRYTAEIRTPLPRWSNTTTDFVPADTSESREALHAMDVALLSFARKQIASGLWILNGNKVFSPAQSKQYVLNDRFVGMLGYHASFRACLSGLALVKDISVTCFLKGGNLVDFVTAVLGCRRSEDLPYEMKPNNPCVQSLVDLLKNCKVRVTHLTTTKKFRSFSHAANSQESAFLADASTVPVTVADYFRNKYGIRLRYPALPTVDIGSRSRPILMPMEQLVILQGQTRQRSITGDVSAAIIKHAAMLPNDRFRELTQSSFLFPALQEDFDAQAFGISNITAQTGAQSAAAALPMRVKGTILPPAKLQYANRKIEPELKGAWNLAGGVQFAHKPPKPLASVSKRSDFVYPYAALLVHNGMGRSSPQELMGTLQGLLGRLEGESRTLGIPLEQVKQSEIVNRSDLADVLSYFKGHGARIVMVVMLDEALYAEVKFVADGFCLPTQCARYIKVVKCIRNYETNLLIKMNMKLGGTNHTLAARRGLTSREDPADFYQQPPHSISWLFNEPTMVMGIDVNHPSPGKDEASVVAVVASMDGMLGQYCTYITDCSAGHEPVSSLYQSFKVLLRTFCARNQGSFPRNIIVYRDGVADSQFMETLTSELGQLRAAVNSFEYDEDYVKISFVVCQKRHQTRFFFQPAPGEDYMNPCVGLCVDSRGFGPDAANPLTAPQPGQTSGPDAIGCIMGVNRNEFYLNSHAAVLGTSKPTKYILLHDEIGLKMSELQLLTFWLTHLYGRCTRSVSIVAPAYYAHWAARRGKALLQAGLPPAHLKTLSAGWMADADTPAMYFI